MNLDQNKNLVTRFNREFIEDKQFSALDELVSTDFINHTAPPGMQDLKSTIYFFENVLWKSFPSIKVEIHDQIAENDKVTTRKTLHSVQENDFMGISASGKMVSIRVIDIWKISDGKLTEHWGMLDFQDLTSQIGKA